jgi:hypothetical protein
MMIDEREIQHRMRFYHQDMLRERDNDRLSRNALKERQPLFALRLKLPRLWHRETQERQPEAVPSHRSAESGAA